MFPSIIIFIFIILPILSLGQGIQQFRDCSTKFYTCGQATTYISYPFWGNERPSYCGLQGFRLTCREDNVTTLQIMNTTFRVIRIDQNNYKLALALDDLRGDEPACSLRQSNSVNTTTFQYTLFSYVPNGSLILGLYFSCEEDVVRSIPTRQRLNCSADEGGRGSFFENIPITGSDRCERVIGVPVSVTAFDAFNRSETMSFEELLWQGFEMEYRVDNGGICSRCQITGGTCGSYFNSSGPSCMCPDGFSRLVCSSVNVANSVGGPNRPPILIAEEYPHWVIRMRSYLKRKGKNVWMSVLNGPHVRTTAARIATPAEQALGADLGTFPPTAEDLEKEEADETAFNEITYGIPPDIFDFISECDSAKEIWDTLLNMFEGTEKAKDKKQTSAENDYKNFRAAPGESLSSAFKRFKKIMTKLSTSGATKTKLDSNLQFIDGLGDAWVFVKMIIQGSGTLSNMTIYEMYDNLQTQESTVLSNVTKNGGPLALYNDASQNNNCSYTPSKKQEISPSNSTESEEEEEEIYQHELALLTQRFNRNTSGFRRFPEKRPFVKTKPHYTQFQQSSSTSATTAPAAKGDAPKDAPAEFDGEEIKCHNCGGLNHFARDCRGKKKEEKTGNKAYYLAKLKELEEEEKGKSFVVTKDVEYQVWSDGDGDSDDDDKEERRENCLLAVNLGFAETKKLQGVRKPIEKNYCFMASNSNPSGKSIIEQVKSLLNLNNYNVELSKPYLDNLESTLADTLCDYRASISERDICQQEFLALRERFEDKRLKVIKIEKELQLEKDCRTIWQNEQYVITSQRDLARDDNKRLNVLLNNIYKSANTFENIDIIGNTYNWGWSKGCALGNENFPHFKPPPSKEKSPHFHGPGYLDSDISTETTNATDSGSSTEDSTTTSTSLYKLNNNCIVAEDIPTASASDSIPSQYVPGKYRKKKQYLKKYGQKLTDNKVADTLENLANVLKNISAPQHNHAFMYTPLNPKIHKDKFKVENDWSDMSADTDDSFVLLELNKEQISATDYDTETSSQVESLGIADDLPSVDFHSYTKLAEPSISASAIRYKCVINSNDLSFFFEPIDLSCPKIRIRKCKPKRKQILTESNKAWIPKVKALCGEQKDKEWLLDSGCSLHMTGRLDYLRDFKPIQQGGHVTFGNDENGIIKGYGILTNGEFTIRRVAYVHGLKHNLISVKQLCNVGHRVEFDRGYSYIWNEDRTTCLATSKCNGNMYPLNIQMIVGKPQLCFLSKAVNDVSWLWHRRLCHLNFRFINDLVTGEKVRGLPLLRFDNDTLCAACECGKQSKKRHPMVVHSSITEPLQLLHIDLCGPSAVASLHKKKYILVIVDDFTRFTWVFFLRLKSETANELINFIKLVELQLQKFVHKIRSDNGTEFVNQTIDSFLQSKGIDHNLSAPYSPQQNGVVERRNRTLVEAARAMLKFSNLSLYFWAEAVQTACFVQNRSVINKRLDKTPYEALNNKKPDLKFLRIFGCRCFIKNNKDHLGKFEPKADEAIFLGYSTNKKAYRVLNRRTRVIEESFDISFDDFHIRKPTVSTSVTFILESDIPEGYGPVAIPEIDYDTLFGPTETALDSEINANKAPQTQIVPPQIPQNDQPQQVDNQPQDEPVLQPIPQDIVIPQAALSPQHSDTISGPPPCKSRKTHL
ncbi:hypothetical protein LXL04_025653 [Taraxacum kok-saghyz]